MKAKRARWFLILLLLLLLIFPLTVTWRHIGDRALAADPTAPGGRFEPGKKEPSQFTAATKAAARDDGKQKRAALGRVAKGGINPAWGLVRVDNLQGRPQNGDQAYIARLGPEGGLMTVASVEENQVVLEFGTLDPEKLEDGDRIETMPPAR